jgi:hypothetical protein
MDENYKTFYQGARGWDPRTRTYRPQNSSAPGSTATATPWIILFIMLGLSPVGA